MQPLGLQFLRPGALVSGFVARLHLPLVLPADSKQLRERNDMPVPKRRINFRSYALNFVAPSRASPATAQSLIQTVQAAVRTLDQRALRPLGPNFSGMAFQPKVLLALLTYCYARKIYSSMDIEEMMGRDTAFCEACQYEFPGARIISQFRNYNRPAIRACLIAALTFLSNQKVEEGILGKVNEACIAVEAARRLVMAICIDNLELNDGTGA